MKTLTWTVEFDWDYDLDYYVENAIRFIKENLLNIEEDLPLIKNEIRRYIDNDITGEDDYLYYNFGDSEFDTIINEVIKEIKNNYSIQIPLDI